MCCVWTGIIAFMAGLVIGIAIPTVLAFALADRRSENED